MTLEELGNELRQYRLAKNISLTTISTATRINIKFLEALEQGNFSILPQTYIRAFLREYAHAVGVDENDILAKYTEILAQQSSASPPQAPLVSPVPQITYTSPSPGSFIKLISEYRYYVFAGLVVAGLLIWYFYASTPKPQEPMIEELPFERVIKETELSTGVSPKALVEREPAATVPRPLQDSLTLTILTSDSVWMSISIDDSSIREYIFPPNTRRSFKAASQFTITAGNAGAVSLRLNDKDLGILGKKGSVVRNKVLSRQILLTQ